MCKLSRILCLALLLCWGIVANAEMNITIKADPSRINEVRFGLTANSCSIAEFSEDGVLNTWEDKTPKKGQMGYVYFTPASDSYTIQAYVVTADGQTRTQVNVRNTPGSQSSNGTRYFYFYNADQYEGGTVELQAYAQGEVQTQYYYVTMNGDLSKVKADLNGSPLTLKEGENKFVYTPNKRDILSLVVAEGVKDFRRVTYNGKPHTARKTTSEYGDGSEDPEVSYNFQNLMANDRIVVDIDFPEGDFNINVTVNGADKREFVREVLIDNGRRQEFEVQVDVNTTKTLQRIIYDYIWDWDDGFIAAGGKEIRVQGNDWSYIIDDVRVNGVSKGKVPSVGLIVDGDTEIEFDVHQAVRDRKMRIYVDAAYISDALLRNSKESRQKLIVGADNDIMFGDEDLPMFINMYTDVDDESTLESLVPKFYINDELQTDTGTSRKITAENVIDGMIVKCYYNNVTETVYDVTMSYTNLEFAPIVLRDNFSPVNTNWEWHYAMEGTQFLIYAPSGYTIDHVTANGTYVIPNNDGSYTVNIHGRTDIVISGAAQTGIESVEAADANAPVYNLQGMKVADNAANLPTGLYIVNGKKVILK